MRDQIDLTIDNIIRKQLQRLEPDEQIKNVILNVDGFNSSSQNISLEPIGRDLINHIDNCKNRPQFEQPYESPLEEIFAYNIVKYLDKVVIFQKQVTVDTLCGRFRLDFMIQRSGICIGLECDGEEYHSPLRDEWRDAMILETGCVVAIYRFRGKDIFSNIEDCLFFLSLWEPQLFLERGLACLKVLASDEARTKACQVEFDEIDHIFCGYEKHRYEYGIQIEKHSYRPCNYGNSFLKEIISFAKRHGGGELDHLMEKFDAKRVAF